MPVQVKICGITNVEDAVAAAKFGADFIGLNFYPGSPRYLDQGMARLILQALPNGVTPIALFVNEPWERIRGTLRQLGITFAQIHGDKIEPCPFVAMRWIAAFPLRDDASVDAIQTFCESCKHGGRPEAVLVDAHVPGKYGGTGTVAPWPFARRILPLYRLILAGGLTPENVAEAIRSVQMVDPEGKTSDFTKAINLTRPWAVDVASGVESAPGIKDHDKMRRFIENAKAVVT